jgi:hypothetical protein
VQEGLGNYLNLPARYKSYKRFFCGLEVLVKVREEDYGLDEVDDAISNGFSYIAMGQRLSCMEIVEEGGTRYSRSRGS